MNYGDFVAAANRAYPRARFGAEERSVTERFVTAGAILAFAIVASMWAKRVAG